MVLGLLVASFMFTGCDVIDILIQNDELHVIKDGAIVNTNTSGNQIQNGVNYYFYNQLSRNEKGYYDDFYEGLMNMDPEFEIDTGDSDMIYQISLAIMYDHPEIFWFRGAYHETIYSDHIIIKPNYTHTTYDKASMQQEIDANANAFLATVSSSLSDYEKIKYVFEHVISSVEYVTGAPENQTIYSSIVNKQSVCAGYTRATQYYLQKLGFETLYVSGDVVGEGSHAWAIVKCNGKYYHVDSTFGDRTFSDTTNDFPEVLNINYTYLCMSDDEMMVGRVTDMPFELPKCTSTDLNYHQLNHLLYSSYSEDVMKQSMKDALYNGNNYWQCRFTNESDFRMALNAIENKLYTNTVLDYLIETQDIYSVNTTWSSDDKHYTIVCWY